MTNPLLQSKAKSDIRNFVSLISDTNKFRLVAGEYMGIYKTGKLKKTWRYRADENLEKFREELLDNINYESVDYVSQAQGSVPGLVTVDDLELLELNKKIIKGE